MNELSTADYINTLSNNDSTAAFVIRAVPQDSISFKPRSIETSAANFHKYLKTLNKNTHHVYCSVLEKRLLNKGLGQFIWVDLDLKDLPKLNELYRVPLWTMRVMTGRGAHLYWKLKEAQPVDLIEGLNKALAETLGGDPRAFDKTRVLRVPGTYNLKCDPPKLVKAYAGSEHLWDIDDFKFTATVTKTSGTKTYTPKHISEKAVALEDFRLTEELRSLLDLAVCSPYAEKFKDANTGDIDWSKMDFYVCGELYVKGFSVEEIKGAMLNHAISKRPIHRQKTNYTQYLHRTIQRAANYHREKQGVLELR